MAESTRRIQEALRLIQRNAHACAEQHGFWQEEIALLNYLRDLYKNEHGDLQRKANFMQFFKTALRTIVMEKLLLIGSETVGEGCEAARDSRFTNDGEPGSLAEELADTVIRIFDLAEWLEIDMATEIVSKMQKNRTRSHKHNRGA